MRSINFRSPPWTLACFLVFLSGCQTAFPVPPTTQIPIPKTPGDQQNAPVYGYTPLDPLPVELESTLEPSEILSKLPDETMRIAIGSVDASGGISFGPAKIGAEGNSYEIVLDYIKFDTRSMSVHFSEQSGKRIATLVLDDSDHSKVDMVVPVYIGVGLRMTANIYIKKGSIDLGNLLALGVAAKADQLSGTLVIQTLGLSGPEVSDLIPMPSELSESSVQNAILALASIKSKMYDANTVKTPRVVGVYNDLGGGADTINGFISSLLEQPIPFPQKPKSAAPLPNAAQHP